MAGQPGRQRRRGRRNRQRGPSAPAERVWRHPDFRATGFRSLLNTSASPSIHRATLRTPPYPPVVAEQVSPHAPIPRSPLMSVKPTRETTKHHRTISKPSPRAQLLAATTSTGMPRRCASSIVCCVPRDCPTWNASTKSGRRSNIARLRIGPALRPFPHNAGISAQCRFAARAASRTMRSAPEAPP
jgi:hypothetical protein